MNKIKSIEINAFRAFKDSEKFDFINHEFNEVSNLIVLYAPNGSGKTSFMESMNHYCQRFGLSRLLLIQCQRLLHQHRLN